MPPVMQVPEKRRTALTHGVRFAIQHRKNVRPVLTTGRTLLWRQVLIGRNPPSKPERKTKVRGGWHRQPGIFGTICGAIKAKTHGERRQSLYGFLPEDFP